MRGWLVGWSCLCLVACGLGRVAPPAPPRTTKLGLTLQSFGLTNGLRVVLVKDPKASDIQVTMRYRVGSADDPPDQRGMAHLVEHLMFQQVLGSQTVFAQLESATTSFNGTTTFDATTYVARADRSRLDKLLAIEAVRVGFRCTTINESVFIREREVVVNEERYRGESHELHAALLAGLYPESHPYRRAAATSVNSVGAITFEEACAFADAHYTPDNAVLVVSGNLTFEEVKAALDKFLARVAKRSVTGARTPVARPKAGGRVELTAPIDDNTVLIAFPLPLDPLLQTRMRAVAAAAALVIDNSVAGRVMAQVIGDERAPMFAIGIVPADDETVEQVIRSVDEALRQLPLMFQYARVAKLAEIAFGRIHQSAVYELYAGLEDGSERDSRLASYVLSGRDPQEALAAEFRALRELTSEVAADIADEYVTLRVATIVLLEPTAAKAGARVELRPPVHDRGLRRELIDPQAAHAPEPVAPPRAVPGVTTRRLANGMTIVLLPITSVPTVEMRLVFGSGSADESVARRGVSLVAANGLDWDLRHLDDLIKFAAAGGSHRVEVDTDRTTFIARGVDMHLDVLLAGLRRWVRDGTYEGADSVVEALRIGDKRIDDDGALTDAWRVALFGPHHPYVHAGLVRHASTNVTVADAEQFRAAHFTPDNATLVIAGRFDVSLADRWIDYLFADWSGRASARTPEKTQAPGSASLAMLAHSSSIHLNVALPATAGSRAQQLVAAAMLTELARDVRHQLGAAYVVDAALVERRRANHYAITGTIDSTRVTAAMELLRDRVAALITTPDTAASAFVAARRRVITQLRAIGGSAIEIATMVERDVELAREPLSNLALTAAVAALTIDDMATVLAELDLSRAAVLMRGPHSEVKAAFAVLGREPRYIMADQAAFDALEDAPDRTSAAPPQREREPVMYTDLEDALTGGDGGASSGLAITIAPGYAFASTIQSSGRVHADCCSGLQLSAFVGYRLDKLKTLGVQVTVGSFAGTYTLDLASERVYELELRPIHIAAAFHGNYDRLWGGVYLGLHLDRRTEVTTGASGSAMHEEVGAAALAVGLQGGVDVVKFRGHRLGLFGLVQGTLISVTGYSSLTLGLAYRR